MIVTTKAIVATGSYNPKGAPRSPFTRGRRSPTVTTTS